jgi:hypothetical protein
MLRGAVQPMHGTFYPPLEGEGRSRSERGGVISPRAQMYRFRRPWAGSGTTETPPRGQTVTPPRPHRRCGASSAADDPPPPGEGKKERGAPDRTRTHFLGRWGGGAASAVLVRCGRDTRSMDFRPELPPPQPSPREERERERSIASVDMIRTSETLDWGMRRAMR